jgi:hypothetical protein
MEHHGNDVIRNNSNNNNNNLIFCRLFENSGYASITVIFIAAGNRGASLRTSLLRFLGTTSGAVAGSFIEVFVGEYVICAFC